MVGRRRLSYPQTQALQALATHRAKILGFTAEFEARKAAEYSEAVSGLRDEEAQLVASLLDLDTPKIRIAEVMGTKNYGNLVALHEAANQYRNYPEPAQEKPETKETEDVSIVEVKSLLRQLHKYRLEATSAVANEHGEWEEVWRLGGSTLTFLRWSDGCVLLDVTGLTYASTQLAQDDHAEEIIEGIYGKEQA